MFIRVASYFSIKHSYVLVLIVGKWQPHSGECPQMSKRQAAQSRHAACGASQWFGTKRIAPVTTSPAVQSAGCRQSGPLGGSGGLVPRSRASPSRPPPWENEATLLSARPEMSALQCSLSAASWSKSMPAAHWMTLQIHLLFFFLLFWFLSAAA